MELSLDERPIIVALAGPNGAGKTTFYGAFLRPQSGLRFVNADVFARELHLDPYAAAQLAANVRSALLDLGESFVFETVFSDPAGAKLTFMKDAAQRGYAVLLCFIGIEGVEMSEQRVAMRVTQGGHDVPREKIAARFPRIMQNLKRAIRELPHVRIYDNSNMQEPFRLVVVYKKGKQVELHNPVPAWLRPILRAAPPRPRPNL